MKLLFWISAVAIVYTYVGYPSLLLVLRLFIRRPVRRAPIEPLVSLIIPAYNEARVIEEKLRNVTALDYPREKLEIIVVSDGSNDNTVELAKAFESAVRIRVLGFPQNRGKMAVLNDAVRASSGEILLLSDASAMLQADALRNLISNFADPNVGAVCGLYRVLRASEAKLGVQEDFYWKYETFLKSLESDLYSTVGAHGQILALRKTLYPFPDNQIINDDHVIPMRVLAGRHRVIYDTRAIAFEKASEMTGFQRRVRIMAGNLQQLREMRGLLWPIQILPLIFVISRKTLRSLVPLFLILMAVSNLFLLHTEFYRIIALCQLAFYVLAGIGAAWNLRPALLRLPYYFCSVNAAYLWSALQFPLGIKKLKWE
jgi:cellulose synthase/poly-beta-1,6-N-acetylglucosamine synthase-like glycosyltransferase